MAYEIENESDDDLDLSWIQEEQSLLAEPTTQSVKKVMSEIAFHCIYIGPNQEIVAHNRGLCPLDIHENHSTLSNARLLKYIKGNQCYDGIPYKFGDVILYHINIDFEHIQAFVSCGSAGTFTPISMFEDVVIQPSLILFQSLQFARSWPCGPLGSAPTRLRPSGPLHGLVRVDRLGSAPK